MPRDIPVATYRLQLRKEFGFDDAAQLVPYLKALGISHVYASPFLKARSGSTHGYDIVDHAQLNPEFGGPEGFDRLSQALAKEDLGLILDFVPNHMGIGRSDNAWWLDVLEWGPRSPHAASFDIDWDTLPYKAEGGVLLPILGRSYGDVLETGEIKLTYEPDEGSFSAWYYEHRLPIRPSRYGEMLRTIVAASGAADSQAGLQIVELAGRHPDPREPSREQAPAFKADLRSIAGGETVIAQGIQAYHPSPDEPGRVIALHRLLERQHYRLAHWRVAGSEINYRRFFDVNDLAGIRIENLRTFTATHRLVAELIANNQLHGLRLDHIDGLHDPIAYCRRLQSLTRRSRGAWRSRRPFYILVEKILADGERLPQFPGVAGTTGYEWLNVISRTLVDGRGIRALDDLARDVTGRREAFADVLDEAKRRVLHTILASEFVVLSRLLARIAAGHWRTRDFTEDGLRAALELYVLCFPVYRTYIDDDGAGANDRATIGLAIAEARARWFGPDSEIFDFLQDALTLDLVGPERQGYSKARVRRFAMKVQQFTGPIMAKSLEDTTFYRYFHLLALNEVGGDPTLPALTSAAFHDTMADRVATQPHGMTATATHDTKRGEDARARLLALSELADDWREEVEEWKRLNLPAVGTASRKRCPSAAHEYMLYQTLLGAWPFAGPDEAFVSRMEAYAVKAAREGKLETSWLNPDEAYEAGFTGFVREILAGQGAAVFVERVAGFAARLSLLGALNSLAQLTLKAMMPGVPDFYQGTELWDLSLVDPDNRRPVDFSARSQALAEIGSEPDWSGLVAGWQNGRIKLALTQKLLALRGQFPGLFSDGHYRPLEVMGLDAEHVIAFARSEGERTVIVAVGRHFAQLTGGGRNWPTAFAWDAAISVDHGMEIHDVLRRQRFSTNEPLGAGRLFDTVPVAVLLATKQVQRRGAGVRAEVALPSS